MEYKIALIPGDGIGPEIVAEAKKVLDRVCEKYSHKFSYTEVLLGGASIDAHGVPLTEEAIAQAKASDAVLMGSIGGDAKTSPWYKLEPSKRPEAGLLAIRKALNLFANLRPAYLYNELRDACPLRDEIIGDGFDMIIVRELTGGLYFGARKTTEENGVRTAVDTLSYNENEIRRIAIKAFEIARKRRNKVTSVDKANVLDSSRLWRSVVEDVAKDYPDVEFYAWDVVNEAASDAGTIRDAGSNNEVNGQSAWVKVYGDQSYIPLAFEFAKKYAPAGCKLFYKIGRAHV